MLTVVIFHSKFMLNTLQRYAVNTKKNKVCLKKIQIFENCVLTQLLICPITLLSFEA